MKSHGILRAQCLAPRSKVNLLFSSLCPIALLLSLNDLNINFQTLVLYGIIVFHLEMPTALLHWMAEEDFSEGMRLWWTKWAFREGSLRLSGGMVGRTQGGRAGPPRRKALFWLLAGQCFPLSLTFNGNCGDDGPGGTLGCSHMGWKFMGPEVETVKFYRHVTWPQKIGVPNPCSL